MSPEQFVYWLQGALELGRVTSLDEEQVMVIQDHLNLVLKKETPKRQQPQLPAMPPIPVQGPTIVESPRFQIPNWNPDTTPVITC